MTLKEFKDKFKFLPVQVNTCVSKVMKQGHDKSSALAICRSALGMSSAPNSPGVPQDIHNRGNRTGGKQEIFDDQVDGGGGIHTPQFIKVQKKSNFELDPLWKQTKDVMNVEIFEAGTWKGRTFTENDLQDAVQNFRDGILGAEPYVTIDHDDNATKEFSHALDGMALGFVSNLYKIGKKLIADFTKVPRIIAELIMAGPLKNKSIELWPEFEAADGTIYKNVLEAVTFTGKIPAVAGLSDVVSLFKRETGIVQKDNRRKIKLTTGGKKMSEITIEQSEYTELLKFKANKEVAEDQVLKFKADLDKANKEIENRDKKIVDLEKFKADTQKANEVREHDEAVSFADSLIKKGTITPAHKDLYIDQFKMYKGKGPEMFKAFTDEIEARKPVVITGEMSFTADKNGKPSESNKKLMENQIKMIFKKGGKSMYDDANKLIKQYCEKHNVPYDQAMKHFGILKDNMEAEADARKKMDAEEEKNKAAYEAEQAEAEGEENEDEEPDEDEKDGKDDDEKDDKPSKK